MPANRGLSGPNWCPQPDILPHAIPFEATTECTSYVPANAKDCSKFIIENCQLPDIEAYAGLPEAQQGIADSISESVFEVGRDVMPALQRRLVRRARQEEMVRRGRWLEVNTPAPITTQYVVSKRDLGSEPQSVVAGTRKSRVSA